MTPRVSEKTLQDILNSFVDNPSISTAMKKVGGTRTNFYRYLRSDVKISFPDRSSPEKILFRDGYALARRMWKIEFDAKIREAVSLGDATVATGPDGRVLFEVDYALLRTFGAGRKSRGGRAGRCAIFLIGRSRDPETGVLERIPMILRSPTPATLRIHGARSLLGDAGFNPAMKQEVDSKVTGSVLVLNAAPTPHLKPYDKNYVPPADEQKQLAPPKKTIADRVAELQAKYAKNPTPLVADLVEKAKQVPANPRPETGDSVLKYARAASDDPPDHVTGQMNLAASETARPAVVKSKLARYPAPAPGGMKMA